MRRSLELEVEFSKYNNPIIGPIYTDLSFVLLVISLSVGFLFNYIAHLQFVFNSAPSPSGARKSFCLLDIMYRCLSIIANSTRRISFDIINPNRRSTSIFDSSKTSSRHHFARPDHQRGKNSFPTITSRRADILIMYSKKRAKLATSYVQRTPRLISAFKLRSRSL